MSSESTKKVIAMLRSAGWAPRRSVGRHTVWKGPNGTQFTLPDGHRQISPGVLRKLLAAMKEDSER